MHVSRRRFLLLATAAAIVCPLPPGVFAKERWHPSISPFKPGTRHHETFMAMQRSAPLVEARLRQWIAVVRREAEVLKTSDHPALVNWRRQLAELPGTTDEKQVAAVNRIVNGDVRYVTDWQHGRSRDRWYGPVETLEEGGDCEDYALLKGYLLYALGWPTNRLHLVAGILLSGEAHMMLGVDYGNGRRVLLDNRSPRIHPRPYGGWKPKYQIGPHQKTLVYFKASS